MTNKHMKIYSTSLVKPHPNGLKQERSNKLAPIRKFHREIGSNQSKCLILLLLWEVGGALHSVTKGDMPLTTHEVNVSPNQTTCCLSYVQSDESTSVPKSQAVQ